MPGCRVSESSDKGVPYRVTLENSWVKSVAQLCKFFALASARAFT